MHAVLPLALTKLRAPATPPVVLAYSGGGDSTFLLQRLCASGAPVLALIVDHGLRDGSAADAARAFALAREAGADAEILTLAWPNGPKPAQAHARAARLRALAAAARRAGGREIALAHTLDDQAETVLIRVSAHSAWRGLAGMAERAPLPIWPEGRGLTIVRPLLKLRRADLRETLRKDGAAWIEDPANEMPRYARVRARRQLKAWEGEGLGPARWAALAEHFAPLAAASDEAARACLTEAATFNEGEAEIVRARFDAHCPETRSRALAVAIAAVSGGRREPGEAAAARLLAGEGPSTLGGAVIRRTKDRVRVTRDPGGLLGREGVAPLPALSLTPGQALVWDGRLALVARAPGWRCEADSRTCRPIFVRGQDCLTLTQARDAGLIEASWLFRERIAHLLWR